MTPSRNPCVGPLPGQAIAGWPQPTPGPYPRPGKYPPVPPVWPPKPPTPNPDEPVVPVVHAPQEHPLVKKVEAFVRQPPHKGAGARRTHLVFVLDASSSMLQGKDITIGGFNQQVDIVREQAEGAGETTVSIVVFNDTVRIQSEAAPLTALAKLDGNTYRPCGSTALYDAVGAAIELCLRAQAAADPGTAFFVAVFTDGEENASRHCTGAAVGKAVELLQGTGRFTFTLMGPREGLDSLAQVLSVERGNVAGFDPSTLVGRTRAFDAMAGATLSYMALRSAGAASAQALYTGDAQARIAPNADGPNGSGEAA